MKNVKRFTTPLFLIVLAGGLLLSPYAFTGEPANLGAAESDCVLCVWNGHKYSPGAIVCRGNGYITCRSNGAWSGKVIGKCYTGKPKPKKQEEAGAGSTCYCVWDDHEFSAGATFCLGNGYQTCRNNGHWGGKIIGTCP